MVKRNLRSLIHRTGKSADQVEGGEHLIVSFDRQRTEKQNGEEWLSRKVPSGFIIEATEDIIK